MKCSRPLMIAASAIAMMGCVPLPVTTYRVLSMTTPPSVDEYAPYRLDGNSTITGQAFLTTRGGDVKRGAGRSVTLDPATSYTRAWYDQIGLDRDRFGEMPSDSLFRSIRRTTTADADGKFSFRNLPPGTYLVRTTVTWEVPTGSAYLPTEVQGGVVSVLAVVKGGETSELILNSLGSAYLR
jgi:hypothetical protein